MDIKKLFPEKKISKKRILEFLDKRGFYIVLILCIAVVGTTAVFVTTHNISSPDIDMQKMLQEEANKKATAGNDTKPAVQSSISTNPATPAQGKVSDSNKQATQGTPTKPASQQTTAQNNTNQQNKTSPSGKNSGGSGKSGSSGSSSSKNIKFIAPVSGGVTFEYAQDKLVYSKTLEEWITHSGVDLAADRGTPVKAVADGVVTEVISDPRFGYTVIIEHANGLKTVYSNLASDDMVVPNQKVKSGDVVGAVGNTANFEVSEQPHLHFEVLKNNEPVNPLAYLPAIK